jgi:hypothetical protein
MNVETLAYVYKWTHLPTLMWYVGSRTAEGCHPEDRYICSSKSVSMKGRPSPKKGISIISEKRYYHNGSISKKFIPGTEPKGFVSGRLIAKRRTRAEIAQVL